MKKDLGFYVDASLEKVYGAYLSAAAGEPFRRICHQTPLHTISFDLSFSFKYNMNGGSCTIRLMPRGSGCAVNLSFFVLQAFGARIDAYSRDLTNAVQTVLPVAITPPIGIQTIFCSPGIK